MGRREGGVYYLVSPHCRETYIGETKQFRGRWDTHMASVRGTCAQRVHKWMRNFRGMSSYVMLPFLIIHDLEEDEKDNARNRRIVEKWMIQRYRPHLNDVLKRKCEYMGAIEIHTIKRIYNRAPPSKRKALWTGAHTLGTQTQSDNRPGHDKYMQGVPHTYTTYLFEETKQASHNLDMLLKLVMACGKSGCVILISHGDTTINPYETLNGTISGLGSDDCYYER
jgi:GIY-YIG catalytic domain